MVQVIKASQASVSPPVKWVNSIAAANDLTEMPCVKCRMRSTHSPLWWLPVIQVCVCELLLKRGEISHLTLSTLIPMPCLPHRAGAPRKPDGTTEPCCGIRLIPLSVGVGGRSQWEGIDCTIPDLDPNISREEAKGERKERMKHTGRGNLGGWRIMRERGAGRKGRR